MPLSWFASSLRSRGVRISDRRRTLNRRRRLTLESLEDRTVLSTYTWTGASGIDLNWSTPANWSLSKVPSANDDVVFANGSVNSAVNSDVTVKSVTIRSAYKGTLSLNANLTSTGSFSQAGGALKANSYGLTFGASFTVSGGTFNAGLGTVTSVGGGTAQVAAGSTTFYDFVVDRGGSLNASAAINVAHNLTFNNLATLTGQINAQGDVTTKDTSIGGAGLVNFNGAGAQKLSAGVDGGQLPNVKISKTGGALALAGDSNSTISVAGNWLYSTGGVNAGTSEVEFAGGGTATVDTGPTRFYDVVVNRAGNNLSVGSSLRVGGDLTIASVGSINGALGAVTVGGDLTSLDSTVGGTADITMVGTGTATIQGGDFPNGGVVVNRTDLNAKVSRPLDGPLIIQSLDSLSGEFQVGGNVTTNDASIGGGGVVNFIRTSVGPQNIYVGHDFDQLPNVKIASSGTLNLGAVKLSISGGWEYAKGTVNAGTSTVKFAGGGAAAVNTGSSRFNNVVISRTGGLDAGAGMNVAGSLVIDSLVSLAGQINAQGDVTTNDSSIGGAGVVNFSRTSAGTQNVYVGHDFDQLPNVKIASSGTVNLGAAKLSIAGGWGYTKGTVNGGTSTVKFVGGGAALVDTGSSRFNNVVISRAGGLDAGAGMNVAGSLVIESVAPLYGQINAQGDVTTKAASITGAGVVNFNGAGPQKLIAGVNGGQLPSVSINKPAGSKLTLGDADDRMIAVSGNWTYTSGIVDAGSSKVAFVGASSATVYTGAATSFANVVISRTGGLNANGGMNVAGSLVIENLGSLAGQINAQGDVTTNDSSIGGAGFVAFVGSGAQKLSAGVDGAQLPNVFVNKSGGVLTLAGGPGSTITVAGNWFYNSGGMDAGTSTVKFVGAGTATVDTGSTSFNDVVIERSGNVNVGSSLRVGGDLTITSVLNINGASGAITVGGDLTSLDPTVGGSADITLIGGDSTITGGDFPNGGIIIAKAAGAAVHLGSSLSGVSSLALKSGTLDLGSYTLAVAGLMTVSSGAELEFASTGVTQLTVNGNLTIASGGKITVDSISPAPAVGSTYDLIAVAAGRSLIAGDVVVTVPTGYSGILNTGTNGKFRVTRNS